MKAPVADRRRKPDPRSPTVRPWHPAPYSTDDVYALQALAAGRASATQQARALDFILHRASGVDEPTFIPDNPRESDFAAGKRHVGMQIRKLVGLPPAIVKGMRDKENAPTVMGI